MNIHFSWWKMTCFPNEYFNIKLHFQPSIKMSRCQKYSTLSYQIYYVSQWQTCLKLYHVLMLTINGISVIILRVYVHCKWHFYYYNMCLCSRQTRIYKLVIQASILYPIQSTITYIQREELGFQVEKNRKTKFTA